MKHNRITGRLLSLALIVGMALSYIPSLALTAKAGSAPATYPQITIRSNGYVSTPDDNGAKNDEELKTRFWAYQIFSGTIDKDEFKEEYDGNWNTNRLKVTGWGASIQAGKQEDLLKALSEDKTLARDLGITFELMLQAGEYYLEAENLTAYAAEYNNKNNWVPETEGEEGKVGGELTTAGRAALEKAFDTDLEKLTIGNVFAAAYKQNSETMDVKGAFTASQVISDFTGSQGNTALTQAFYAIVFDKDTSGYKYLKNSGGEAKGAPESSNTDDKYKGAYAVSSWTQGNSTIPGYWTIGEWNGLDIDKGTLPPGYYMIRDAYEEMGNEGKASAAYMTGVYGYGTIDPKAEAPYVTKTIANASYSGASHELGETITFTLKGTLPENYFTAYKGYPYIFEDTMAAGLTYGGITRVYVKVPNTNGRFGTGNAKYDYYLVDLYNGSETGNTGNGYRLDVKQPKDDDPTTKIEVSFPNLKNVKGRRASQSSWNTDAWNSNTDEQPVTIPITNDSEIYVEYTATLNEGANITDPSTGNQNEVILRYANEPLWDPAANFSGGTWDENWREAPKGKSTKQVYLYDFGIQLRVLDEEENPLAGAAFALKKGGSGTTGYQSYSLITAAESEPSYAILHRVETRAAGGTDPDQPIPAQYTYYLAGWVTEDDLIDYRFPNTGDTKSWDDRLIPGVKIGSFTVPSDGDYYVAVKTQSDGLVRIVGMDGDDTYFLEEVIPPEQYDITDDISVSFNPKYYPYGILETLTAAVSDGIDGDGKLVDGGKFTSGYEELVVRLTIVQEPSNEATVNTGGMGAALFYIGGSALLIGAAAVLALSNVKKRPGKQDR